MELVCSSSVKILKMSQAFRIYRGRRSNISSIFLLQSLSVETKSFKKSRSWILIEGIGTDPYIHGYRSCGFLCWLVLMLASYFQGNRLGVFLSKRWIYRKLNCCFRLFMEIANMKHGNSKTTLESSSM